MSFAKPIEFRSGDQVRLKTGVMRGEIGTLMGREPDSSVLVYFEDGSKMLCGESLGLDTVVPGILIADVWNLELVKRGGNTE